MDRNYRRICRMILEDEIEEEVGKVSKKYEMEVEGRGDANLN